MDKTFPSDRDTPPESGPPARDPNLGTIIADRYALIAKLGVGGMGVVYSARDQKLRRTVALKLLAVGEVGLHEARARLFREARAATRVRHRAIVEVFEVGDLPDGGAYLAMELVDGRTLRSLITTAGIDRWEAVRVILEVASALEAAHAAGLVHRDVKPDNVMIRRDGMVALLDFGIVKTQAAPGSTTANADTALTLADAVLGTPAYLAPELALGDEVGPAADQFALAVMSYELLTGQRPWSASTVAAMLAAILEDPPLPATQARADLPEAVDAVFARAFEKKPGARFAGVGEFTSTLERALSGDAMDPPSPAPLVIAPTPTGSRAPRRLAVISVAAAALMGSVAAGLHWTSPIAPAAAPTAAITLERGVVACPVLRAAGVDQPAGWLGAAAADLACRRITWRLGGRTERTRTPAELLDMPREPRDDLPIDPYAPPEIREKTLRAAEAGAQAILDGMVTRDGEHFTVALALTRPDHTPIATAAGDDEVFFDAIDRAVDALFDAGALPRAKSLDPEIAAWMGFDGVEAGVLAEELLFDSERRCKRLEPARADLGLRYFYLAGMCNLKADDAHPAPRSSPREVAQAVLGSLEPDAGADTQALLADARARETSPTGRSTLAHAEAQLAFLHPSVVQRALLAAIRDSPRDIGVWQEALSGSDASTENGTWRLEIAWAPAYGYRFRELSVSVGGDELLGYLRRNYEIGGLENPDTPQYAKQLINAGRIEEARAIASRLEAKPEPLKSRGDFLTARIDIATAGFGRALTRLRALGVRSLGDWMVIAQPLLMLSQVLGRSREVADEWVSAHVLAADRHVDLHDPEIPPTVLLMCTHASRAIAEGCFDRVERAAGLSDASRALLDGGRAHARGDVAGAARAWRSLLGRSDAVYVNLPMGAFDDAGEPALEDRADAARAKLAFYNGLAPSAPRAALRAFARHDVVAARAVAEGVVGAWGAADVVPPGVTAMRSLLAKLR